MATRQSEVVIVGSGFCGSLLAYVLASHSVDVLLVDSRWHPRFTIGESSTPIADLILKKIASDFGLDPLSRLACYGSWKESEPQLICGRKRGFSYFRHLQHEPFQDSPAHDAAMLVAASPDDWHADTHWMRADVDHHFFQLANDAGADHLVGRVTELETHRDGWELRVVGLDGDDGRIRCRFLIDAAGIASRFSSQTGVVDATDTLLTDTESTFGHFDGVSSWDQWLREHQVPTQDFPFPSDDAAQHHLLENGWLWMLRFDSGRTSVGWTRPRTTFGSGRAAVGGSGAVRGEVASRMDVALGIDHYPSLRDLMANAHHVQPIGGLGQTGRLQRLVNRFDGPALAVTPTAGATIDPLHSSGIALGLAGVYRLAKIYLQDRHHHDSLQAGMRRYTRLLREELRLLDHLVAGCYLASNHFAVFRLHCMFYFLAAIHCEERGLGGNLDVPLWSAGDQRFVDLVFQSYRRIETICQNPTSDVDANVDDYRRWVQRVLEPWNHVGLIDPAARNMYHYTTAKK
jgi:FADH2 O2-dependent halogenase